jgi:glycosyltransferase involved in cell wall biosynthesis
MKVLFVSHSCVIGSYRQKLSYLAEFPGYEIHLLVPHRWTEANRSVKASEQLCPGVTLHIERGYAVGKTAWYFFRPGTIDRLVRRIKPDVIHIEEEPWSVACWQAVRAARMIKASVVIFTWDNIWMRYRWISELIMKYTLRHASYIVAGNEEGRNLIQRRGFKYPVFVIPQYGVDENSFKKKPSPWSAMKEKFPDGMIGYIGRLEGLKSVDTIIRAMPLLDPGLGCLIVGDGPEKDSLISLAKELQVFERIIFRDGIPHEQVVDYINILDLLILPSRTTATWKEQFGRILAEAMACEVPVIGSSSGEIPITIGDGGLIFNEGDFEDLGKKIKSVFSNPSLLRKLGKKGKERTLKIFTNRSIASQLVNLYKGLELSGKTP